MCTILLTPSLRFAHTPRWLRTSAGGISLRTSPPQRSRAGSASRSGSSPRLRLLLRGNHHGNHFRKCQTLNIPCRHACRTFAPRRATTGDTHARCCMEAHVLALFPLQRVVAVDGVHVADSAEQLLSPPRCCSGEEEVLTAASTERMQIHGNNQVQVQIQRQGQRQRQ